jgi:hypothetical protein
MTCFLIERWKVVELLERLVRREPRRTDARVPAVRIPGRCLRQQERLGEALIAPFLSACQEALKNCRLIGIEKCGCSGGLGVWAGGGVEDLVAAA